MCLTISVDNDGVTVYPLIEDGSNNTITGLIQWRDSIIEPVTVVNTV